VKKNIASQFKKNGYHIEKKLFSKLDIKKLESEFDKIIFQLENSGENINAHWRSDLTKNIDSPKSKIIHTHNVQSYSSIMMKMVQNKKLLNLAESFIGKDIILHHTKLFLKPPHIGSAFPLHQDWSYFPTKKNTMIAAVVHISDSKQNMGCIKLIPGSHNLGKVKNSDGHSYIKKLHKKYSLESATAIEANHGDVLFFHSCTVHGSMNNESDKPRKTILIQLYSGKDKVLKDNKHTNVQIVLRGWNYNATRTTAENL
tara:strand:+ start:86 stop:856 length:771 start_codon:yes stop_codon:yes gene_type:complete